MFHLHIPVFIETMCGADNNLLMYQCAAACYCPVSVAVHVDELSLPRPITVVGYLSSENTLILAVGVVVDVFGILVAAVSTCDEWYESDSQVF